MTGWEEARLISISQKSALVPHPNQLFLHLLLHLAKHTGMRQNFLGWYTDLDEIPRCFRKEIDGHSCWEILRSGHQADELLEILAFLGLHFNSPLPEIFQAQIKERGISPFPLERIFMPEKQLDLLTFNRNYGVDRREHFLSYWSRMPGFWSAGYCRTANTFKPNTLEKNAGICRSLLEEAVRSRLRVPPGCLAGSLLSGGLDSSSIVSVAASLNQNRLHVPGSKFPVFTLYFPEANPLYRFKVSGWVNEENYVKAVLEKYLPLDR